MGDITQALRAAQSGLLTNQTALNITSQNISNVNTPGYSRKIVQQQSVVLAGTGAGVDISGITRIIDEGLLQSLRLGNADLQADKSQQSYYDRLQQLFGAPGDNTSISHLLEGLQNSAESLSATPDNILQQSDFVSQAQNVVDSLANMSKTIQNLRLQADNQITTDVNKINGLTSDIETLNADIIRFGSTGKDTTDLQDKRDNDLDQLSQLVDIRYFKRGDGSVAVFTSSGKTLVDNVPPTLSHEATAAMTPTSTVAGGQIDGIYVGDRNSNNDITGDLRGGELAGLVNMRDNVLPNLQAQIDNLAASLRDQANAVNNRGTPYPGLQDVTGQRIFVLPGEQTIKFGSGTDTALVLTDNSGNQVQSVRLSQILSGSAYGQTYGDGTDKTSGISITDLAGRLQDYFRQNGAPNAVVKLNDQSQLSINLSSTSLNFGFHDETGTTNGSTAGDASIQFDASGDGNVDQTISGFSNFFGLNNIFSDNRAENLKDSKVLSGGFVSTAATLSFRDSLTPAVSGTPQYLGQISIPAGSSLQDIADLINNNVTDITASVVPEGSGYRLRLAQDNGSSFVVTQGTNDTLLTEMGVQTAQVGTAASLSVRSDLISSPGLLSTGQLQFDSTKGAAGEYLTAPGDNSNATALAQALANPVSFSTAGGLPNLNISFSDYASSILSRNASQASSNDQNVTSKQNLNDSLQSKSDSVRGVNLDEELANLITLQTAYTASARVITTIQQLIQQLQQAVA